jgi:hypothetical protein
MSVGGLRVGAGPAQSGARPPPLVAAPSIFLPLHSAVLPSYHSSNVPIPPPSPCPSFCSRMTNAAMLPPPYYSSPTCCLTSCRSTAVVVEPRPCPNRVVRPKPNSAGLCIRTQPFRLHPGLDLKSNRWLVAAGLPGSAGADVDACRDGRRRGDGV